MPLTRRIAEPSPPALAAALGANGGLAVYIEEEAAQALARPVEVVERRAIEESTHYIRRRRILAEAEALFGA